MSNNATNIPLPIPNATTTTTTSQNSRTAAPTAVIAPSGFTFTHHPGTGLSARTNDFPTITPTTQPPTELSPADVRSWGTAIEGFHDLSTTKRNSEAQMGLQRDITDRKRNAMRKLEKLWNKAANPAYELMYQAGEATYLGPYPPPPGRRYVPRKSGHGGAKKPTAGPVGIVKHKGKRMAEIPGWISTEIVEAAEVLASLKYAS